MAKQKSSVHYKFMYFLKGVYVLFFNKDNWLGQNFFSKSATGLCSMSKFLDFPVVISNLLEIGLRGLINEILRANHYPRSISESNSSFKMTVSLFVNFTFPRICDSAWPRPTCRNVRYGTETLNKACTESAKRNVNFHIF